MIAKEPRCIYARNPLAEVICQLRFPEISSIEAEFPTQFQQFICDTFPRYLPHKEGPPGRQTNNHQFLSADGLWRVNLTNRFISLTTVQYTRWEEYAGRLDKPLAAFIQIYKPDYFERIGLRYVNFISRQQLRVPSVPFKELISPCYLGILAEEDVLEAATARCSTDIDTGLRGGCRCKIHAGPGRIKRNGVDDPEVKFILDLDLYMPGRIPVNHSATALQTLHGQSFGVFRGAITDALHDAMNTK